MRIIAGEFGGRTISAPATRGTRPMTDKVRGALFNMLGPVDGLRVLDVYAGSGALGLEALSRGAAQVTAVEMGRDATGAITKNVQALQISRERFDLVPTSVEAWLARPELPRFDLILADPPYQQLAPEVMERLGRLLVGDGILIVSQTSQLEPPELAGLTLQASKTYGDTTLGFYKPA